LLGRSWWLKIWTSSYETESINTYEEHELAYAWSVQHTSVHAKSQPVHATSENSLGFYLGIYVGLSVVTAVLGTVRFYYMFRMSIKASRSLFEKMTFTVLRAPLRWLDTVPVGRVLNRFTADFNIVDSRLAVDITMLINSFLQVIGICIAAIFVSPYIILLAVILLAWCTRIASVYLDGARPGKRLESTTKSPIFELFGSALTGVATIRGFDKVKPYVDKMYERLDDYDMSTWHLWLFNRWMGWRMSLVGSFFSTSVAILILLNPNMDAALAGFTISFALEFSAAVLWSIRQYSSVELDMNAAERVIEYSDLKTEDLSGEKPPAAWPTEGRLEVNDLVVGYAPNLPPVLKGLSFSVKRNERIGVVGRTGAGKSSLTLALFRFLEPRSGSIHVDGLDISKISLHELRSRLAIIPQVRG
jgi:ABC-type multidrug transport system fused ATPase/permease subunit